MRFSTVLGRLAASEGGQSVIQLAMVAPFLLLITVGSIDFGRYMYDGLEVGNAAHAGVQYGAQSNPTAGDLAGIATATRADAPKVTSLTVTPLTYCACDSNQDVTVSCATTSTSPCGSGDRLDLFVKVTANSTFTPLIRFPGLPHSFTISRSVVQQVIN